MDAERHAREQSGRLGQELRAALGDLEPFAPVRGSIVEIRFESGAMMRRSLCAEGSRRRRTSSSAESGAPQTPPSQAFRRRRLREATELLATKLPAAAQVRCDGPVCEVSASLKVVLRENALCNLVAAPFYEDIAELRQRCWQTISTWRKDWTRG